MPQRPFLLPPLIIFQFPLFTLSSCVISMLSKYFAILCFWPGEFANEAVGLTKVLKEITDASWIILQFCFRSSSLVTHHNPSNYHFLNLAWLDIHSAGPYNLLSRFFMLFRVWRMEPYWIYTMQIVTNSDKTGWNLIYPKFGVGAQPNNAVSNTMVPGC